MTAHAPDHVAHVHDAKGHAPASARGAQHAERHHHPRHHRRADDLPDHVREPLGPYLRAIGEYRVLTREEEVELAHHIADGDAAAIDALVRANLRFVVSVAKRYQHRGLPLADLVGEGNLGLIRAASRFDPDQGVKFISYAVWWIRQAIQQALADQSRIVRLPLHRAGALYRLGRRASALEQELGREATVAELADRTDLSTAELEAVRTIPRACISLDAPASPGGRDPLSDHLADENGRSADVSVMENTREDVIEHALDSLRGREARILRLYYGFEGDPLTLEQIGALLGVTRERVRQLKEKALTHLRQSGVASLLAQVR